MPEAEDGGEDPLEEAAAAAEEEADDDSWTEVGCSECGRVLPPVPRSLRPAEPCYLMCAGIRQVMESARAVGADLSSDSIEAASLLLVAINESLALLARREMVTD
eukprot:1607904-Alexandrium_andersonii.AAC.1